MSRILIIDERLDSNGSLGSLFKKLGHFTTQVPDAREAMTFLTTGGADLVVLNLDVGQLKGWQALGQIRSNPQLAAVPVIACTEIFDPRISALARERGASECLVSGWHSFEDLCDALDRCQRPARLAA